VSKVSFYQIEQASVSIDAAQMGPKYNKREGEMLIILKRFPMVVFLCALLMVGLTVSLSSAGKATKWDVYDWMDRSVIQAYINGASNGDIIFFHAGTYDWSDTPIAYGWVQASAIVINNKTLTLRGEAGTLLIGPQSIDGTGESAQGANAFMITDPDTNNDVTFDRLSIQTFLRGIYSIHITYRDPETNIYVAEPNLRNLTIKNCTFRDIHRDPISISHIAGDVLIQNNEMSGGRFGFYCDWYWSLDHLAWQPENTCLQIIGNKFSSINHCLLFQQTSNVIIKDNNISGAGLNGGIALSNSKNGPIISGNVLSNFRWGIYLLGQNLRGAIIEKNIIKNVVWGIDVQGCRHVVSANIVDLGANSHFGICSDLGNNNYFGQNNIRGTGWCAFWLWGPSPGPDGAHNETLQANNVDNFIPTWAHFQFDPMTYDNLVIGSGMETNTYIDLGVNNRIKGLTPLPGGIGQDLIDAIHLRNEILKEAKAVIH